MDSDDDQIDSTYENFETFEQYLDSITEARDLFYLED